MSMRISVFECTDQTCLAVQWPDPSTTEPCPDLEDIFFVFSANSAICVGAVVEEIAWTKSADQQWCSLTAGSRSASIGSSAFCPHFPVAAK